MGLTLLSLLRIEPKFLRRLARNLVNIQTALFLFALGVLPLHMRRTRWSVPYKDTYTGPSGFYHFPSGARPISPFVCSVLRNVLAR